MSYYHDSSGRIRVDLLDGEAQKIAESFAERNPKNPRKFIMRNTLSSAQLRRFFSEFRKLEKKVKSEDDFYKIKPLIKMVKSKANYAANPSNQKIPKSFKDFLIKNVNEIESKKDFEAFMLHFEAVVGFFYGMGVSNN